MQMPAVVVANAEVSVSLRSQMYLAKASTAAWNAGTYRGGAAPAVESPKTGRCAAELFCASNSTLLSLERLLNARTWHTPKAMATAIDARPSVAPITPKIMGIVCESSDAVALGLALSFWRVLTVELGTSVSRNMAEESPLAVKSQ